MFAKRGHLARRLERRTGLSPRPKPSPVPAFARSGFPSSQCAPQGVSAARAGPAIRDTSRIFGPAGAGVRRPARRAGPLVAAALAVPVLVLSAAAVEAACGVRDRVSHRDSECLRASWHNSSTMAVNNTYSVRNMCPELGRVVVKIDLRQDMDRTLHLHNGYERTGYTEARIRWIYCCSDLSAACNRSDLDRRDGRASAPGATATGSVPDNAALAGAWLAGFGRSVASAQVDRLGERLAAGNRQPHLTLGGYRIGLVTDPEDGDPEEDGDTGDGRWQDRSGRDPAGSVDDRPGRPVTGAMTGRDFLTGSSFLFTGGEAASGRWSGWGSTAPLSFAAAQGAHGDGRLELVGADHARGRLLAGVALSHGSAAGTQAPGGFHGIETSFHGVHPYMRLALDDRFSVWSAFGFWTGEMTLHEGGGPAGVSRRWRTGLDMSMAAVGARGTLLTADEAGGFALTAKADAYAVRIASGAATAPGGGDLAPAEAEADRMRLALDGSRTFRLGPERSLTATLGGSFVRDGGDGGAGMGVGLSASMRHASPGHAISAGLDLFDGGREYTLGWRMEPARRTVPGLRLGLQAARREHTAAYGDTEYAIRLGAIVTW